MNMYPNRGLLKEFVFPRIYSQFLYEEQFCTRSDRYPKRGLFKEFLFLKDFFLFEEKFCPRTHRYPKRGLFKNVFFSNDLGFKDFKVKFLKYFLRTSHAFRT